MSNPSRSQQRRSLPIPVRIQRNTRKLPPLTHTIRSIDQEDESIKPILSITSVDIKHETPRISTVDIKHELSASSSPPVDADGFWVKLRQHIANETSKHRDVRGSQQTPNKIVRIFVSSTFTDFFNEREVLIKKVFPELRDEMESVGVQIIDCDLRWGVPKDSTTEQTILTCLEELDRCFEDNGQPFFIGLISDKYGWVPKMNELPKNITERYRWIDGTSITLMEFIHGAFRTHNPNAFFLIRNSENILKNLPDKYTDKFRDKDELSRKQIQELKSQLSEIVPQDHIFRYDCFYNGLDSKTGRERVIIDGLQEFENQTKQFLIDAIKKWYPENFNTENALDIDQKQMTTFLVNKTQFYVDRPEEFSTLFRYITGDYKDFTPLHGLKKNDDIHPYTMVVTGEAGDGKTMFLGNFVLNIEEKMKDKCLLFYHFLDGAFHPDATHFMYNNLVKKLDKYLGDNNIISPITGQRLAVIDESFLSSAISILPVPLIIVIDGLDKGDIHHQRKYQQEFPFSSFSELKSDHTYIILSGEKSSALYTEVTLYIRYELELQPLTIEQRSSYIDTFFGRFNKTLEPEQKSLLVNNIGGEHPLYLSYVCENLRQFGDYSLVTKRLKTYPQTTDELLDVLLNEVNTTTGNPQLIDGFFKLLIVSSVGILESDIVTMLEHYMNTTTSENNRILVDRMTWSTIRRHLKTFLDTTWIDGHQLIIFRHATLEQKLRKRYFEGNSDEIRVLHDFMSDFYLKYSTIKEFSGRRVPYHYEQANRLKELVGYLRSQQSHCVSRIDRQTYLRTHRCPKIIPNQDGPASQRAYACNVCAMQFKLGPYTMTKSSCFICTNMLPGGNMPQFTSMKREARVCQKHGTMGYPRQIKCSICRSLRINTTGAVPAPSDPVPLSICFECWIKGGGMTRCCECELE